MKKESKEEVKTESRKEFEERLLTELLDEIRVEPLCNILLYAAEYLRGHSATIIRPADLERADILDKYISKLATRVREVRY